jgi:hypothetical protein
VDPSAAGAPGEDADGLGMDTGGLGMDTGGLGMDELALRRMLRGAVEDITPSEGTLDHLRRAVPARRARKRQALVGVAASVILLGTAVPAFVHVANSGGLSDAKPVNAGHGEQAQGGVSAEARGEGGAGVAGTPADGEPGKDGESDRPKRSDASGSVESPASPGAPVGAAADIPAETPICEAVQLAVDGTDLAAPDSAGVVYGTFRVANTSAGACAVTGAGSIDFQVAGAADAAKVVVADHVSGDPATGLPAPALDAGAVLLEPAAAYEVKFAFVPSETCPTAGASPEPTPTDDAAGGATGSDDGAAAATEAEPQLVTADGETLDGSIAVSHTPAAGGPRAETTIPNACAGTIYRTGVLRAS